MDHRQFGLNALVEREHWWFAARAQVIRTLLGELPIGPGDLIVDVGCGTGGTTAAIASDYLVVGIDPSCEAIGLARQRFPEVVFHVGHAPEIMRGLRDIKATLLLDVLEHVEEDFRLLREVVETVAPAGHIVITVPANPRMWSVHDESHRHFRRYERDGLRQLWRQLPVDELLLSYFNARLYLPIRLIRALYRPLGRSFGRAGTDLRPPGLLNRTLKHLFSGEAARLTRALAGTAPPYSSGASLLAILRRKA